MSSKTEPAPWSGGAFYAVVALFVTALFVRSRGLDGRLWVDEIVSILQSFRTPFPQSLAEFPYDNKHPLYSVLAHASISLFGEHAWSVRLPALVFGAASVPLLYAMGTRFTNRRESIAAAAVLTVSYHHVWFSQNARGYTMLAFWAMLTTLVLVDALRGSRLSSWIWYGVICGLGAYTLLTFVFTIAAQAVVVLLAMVGFPRREQRVGIKGPVVGYAVAAVVTLALYAPMLDKVVRFFIGSQSTLEGVSTPGWALSEGLRVLRVGFGMVGPAGAAILAAAATVGVVGAVSYARRQPRMAALLLMPAVFTFGGAVLARGTMYPRFFFGLIGFALLVWLRGAFETSSWIARKLGLSRSAGERLGVAVAVAVVVVSAVSVPLVWRAPKQDFEGAMRFADGAARGGGVIATADVTSLIYGPFYGRDWQALRSSAHLDSLRSGQPVLLVYTFPRYLAVFDQALAATVDRECRSAKRFPGTVGGGEVIVCRLEGT